MFSIQLSIPLLSPLGKRLSLVQHIVGAAIVNALKQHPDYGVSIKNYYFFRKNNILHVLTLLPNFIEEVLYCLL